MTSKNQHQRHWFQSIYLWHRYAGIISAFFVLILAITGLLLQHTDSIKLNRNYLNNKLLLEWYGIKPDTITSFQTNRYWVSHAGKYIYLNDKPLAEHRESLNGALATQENIAIVSDQQLMLFTPSGQLIETFSAENGLPEPALGISIDKMIIRGTSRYWQPDSSFLRWQAFNGPHPEWIKPATLPTRLKTAIETHNINHKINWERFLLDLHTGRLFGKYGVFLMDAAAISLILLACTGIWVWSQRRVKDKLHRKNQT